MFASEGSVLSIGSDAAAVVSACPPSDCIFAVHLREGNPYLGRAANLRRRMARLLRERASLTRAISLYGIAERIEYWPVASRLQASLVLYEISRCYLPERYPEFLKLRMPWYVRLIPGHGFARTHLTTRFSSEGVCCGPFRSRATAERFEHALLDLFRIRRCSDVLTPAPDHPGCIYGEMNMCLRPCQLATTGQEYAEETARMAAFLRGRGREMLNEAERDRERCSELLDFEGAARAHRRAVSVRELYSHSEEATAPVEQLCGAAVMPSAVEGAAAIYLLAGGVWQSPMLVCPDTADERSLRSVLASFEPATAPDAERAEHLALFARWHYPGWRDGIWIGADSVSRISVRRLATAVRKTVYGKQPPASEKNDEGGS